MVYNEITTVTDVRSSYLAITSTTDDTLILDLIREASEQFTKIAGRSFVPQIQTRYFDAMRDVNGALLVLNKDLHSVTSITNGDSVVVATNEYVTEPRNDFPKWAIRLLTSSSKQWTFTTDHENAIQVNGVWAWCPDTGWVDQTTLGAAIATTTATSVTLTSGTGIKAGHILKIDSELLYVSSISGATATVVRGVNGSTAATHLISATVSVWIVSRIVSNIVRRAAAALYRLRDNPISETLVVDGIQFQTPKDVTVMMEQEVVRLGLRRVL